MCCSEGEQAGMASMGQRRFLQDLNVVPEQPQPAKKITNNKMINKCCKHAAVYRVDRLPALALTFRICFAAAAKFFCLSVSGIC